MRQFSDKEKNILSQLVELDNRLLFELIRPLVAGAYDELLEVSSSYGTVGIWISNKYRDSPEANSYVNNLQRNIITLIVLIEYLKNEGWLILHSSGRRNWSFGNTTIDRNNATVISFDINIPTLLFEYSTAVLFIGEALREYVANDFQTTEDIRYKETNTHTKKALSIAKWSVGIAIATGLASAIIGIVPLSSDKKSNVNATLDSSSIDHLNRPIDTTNALIRRMEKSIQELDSTIASSKRTKKTTTKQ